VRRRSPQITPIDEAVLVQKICAIREICGLMRESII